MIARIVIWIVNKISFSLPDKILFTNILIDKVAASPLRDIIQYKEGLLFVNGQKIDRDKAMVLRESAKSALLNEAENLVDGQVTYDAHNYCVRHTTTIDQLFSSKMAIWWGDQRYKHLVALSKYGEETEDLSL